MARRKNSPPLPGRAGAPGDGVWEVWGMIGVASLGIIYLLSIVVYYIVN